MSALHAHTLHHPVDHMALRQSSCSGIHVYKKCQILRPVFGSARCKCKVQAGKGFGGTKSTKPQPETKADGSSTAKKQRRFQQNFKNSALAWDDTFESICKDPATAAQVWQLAEQGCINYGRGCVFVRVEVHDRFKVNQRNVSKSSVAGTPLRADPDLLITSFELDYIPLAHLRPQSSTTSPALPGVGLLPTPDNLIADPSARGPTRSLGLESGTLAFEAVKSRERNDLDDGVIDVMIDNGAVSEEVLDQLRRAMRGMDASRTAQLVGGGDIDVGGERCYEPEKGEAVVLLATRVDGMPLIGADIVARHVDASGSLTLEFPEAFFDSKPAAGKR